MFNFGKFSGRTAPREKKEQIKLYLHTSQLHKTIHLNCSCIYSIHKDVLKYILY